MVYSEFKKCMLKDESKYEVHKNNLTTILTIAEKEYYDRMSEKNKCNIKLMWKTLNVLVKANVSNFHPDEFIYNDNTLNTPVNIAHGFNNFLNVGPLLVSKINPPDSKMYIYDYMKKKIKI